MTITDLFYIVFAVVIVGSVTWIVLTKNLIHALFLFLLSLICLAGIYVLSSANFLAVVQLLVYAGGVVVLLSFGIMLTSREGSGKLISGNHLFMPGIIAFLTMLVILSYFILGAGEIKSSGTTVSIQQIGMAFMTDYLLGFELVAYLLLVVLVGSAYLAKRSGI